MSSRKTPVLGYIERPKFEDQYQEQLKEINDAFNVGDLTAIMYSVDHFESMSDIVNTDDEEFGRDMAEVEAWLEDHKERQIERWRELVKDAINPDVIPRPSNTPPKQYFRFKYLAILHKLQRSGLLMTIKKRAYF